MAFYRGFKTWCENAAKGFRRDLGLDVVSALDPRRLAEHLGVVFLSFDQIRNDGGLAEAHVTQLTVNDAESWSAVTLCLPSARVLVLNPTHSRSRQNSSIAHELAHLILKHKPSRVDMTEAGMMVLDTYDKSLEAEADWLAGSLLVPREALLRVLLDGRTPEEAADFFQVSQQMLTMRRNVTGIEHQLQGRLVRK